MNCVVCNSTSAKHFHIENGFKLMKCAKCGLVYLYPKPSKCELERIYEQGHACTFHRGVDIREIFEKSLEAKKRYRIISRYLSLSKGKRLLEIGCGGGYFLQHMKRAGYSVTGLELYRGLVDFAKNVLGVNVIHGELDSLKQRESFDIIVMFDVISHIYNPAMELRLINSLLSRGGLLIIETGNGAELTSPKALKKWGAPEHLYHFSEENMKLLLKRCGFKLVKVCRFNVGWQYLLLGIRSERTEESPPTSSISKSQKIDSRLKRAIKPLASTLLLWLRYNLGRVGADRRRFCTLFFIARKV